MKITEIKKNILMALWEVGGPMMSREVADQIGLSVRSSTMHLFHLRKKGYVFVPEKGYYSITDLGKEAIGFPKIDAEKASAILSSVSQKKAFYFYTGIDRYTGISAYSLLDFCEKIRILYPQVIEFHLSRGDFEFWFHDLGEVELTKRMRILRDAKFSGEDLRKRVYRFVKSRCEELESFLHT